MELEVLEERMSSVIMMLSEMKDDMKEMRDDHKEAMKAINQRCTNHTAELATIKQRVDDAEKSGKNGLVTAIVSGVMAGASVVVVMLKKL